GFSSIAQVDTKGRARRLPVKADIRKALCFPGGSTLMILHLRKELLDDNSNSGKCLPSQPHQNSFTPAIVENEGPESSGELLINLKTSRRTGTNQSKPKALVKVGSSRGHGKLSGFDSQNPKNCCNDTVASARANDD
ncbi:mediator of DNA damage checkpoint protein, partial [Trifolium medium]|nr:mediator of DNA damage checkpoint protein [Trifolium medium]